MLIFWEWKVSSNFQLLLWLLLFAYSIQVNRNLQLSLLLKLSSQLHDNSKPNIQYLREGKWLFLQFLHKCGNHPCHHSSLWMVHSAVTNNSFEFYKEFIILISPHLLILEAWLKVKPNIIQLFYKVRTQNGPFVKPALSLHSMSKTFVNPSIHSSMAIFLFEFYKKLIIFVPLCLNTCDFAIEMLFKATAGMPKCLLLVEGGRGYLKLKQS